MARILVTGGAGFIGSHLVDALVQRRHTVFVIDDLSVGKKENLNSRARFIKTSVVSGRTASLIQSQRFDFIYHLAAQKNLQYSKSHPLEDAETNIIGSLKIIGALKKSRRTKIIFYSTAAVYDPDQPQPVNEKSILRPVTPYGIGKLTVELYLRQAQLPYTVLRLANVYGPRQDARGEGGVVAIFCDLLKRGLRPVIFNSGKNTRDYVYVSDVVSASLQAMHRANNETINVSTGLQTSVLGLFRIAAQIAEKEIKPKFGQLVAEQKFSALSKLRAQKILKWHSAVTLRSGLQLTYSSKK